MVAAWALGVLATAWGRSATTELSLDLYLAQRRSVVLSQVALVISALLGVSVAPIVLLATAGLVAKIRGWISGLAVLLVTGVDWVAAAVGKLLVHRPRPPAGVLHALVAETGLDSYPSGHTAFAAGLLASAVVVSYLAGRSAWGTAVLGLPAVGVVAVSRLYLGVHYITDVIGSCLVAAASTLLLIGTYNALWRLLQRRSRSGVGLLAPVGEAPARLDAAGIAERVGEPDSADGMRLAGASVEASAGQVGMLRELLGGQDADTPRRG